MSELPRSGYDQLAETYDAYRSSFDTGDRLRQFADVLRPGCTVLDLGSGTGVPVARFLVSQGFSLLGLDLSSRMVELARGNVPGATFETRDMTSLRPGEYQVDGLVALYSIFHVERDRHGELLETFRSFLKVGGAMLVTMGASHWEGVEDFHGVPMRWSHYAPECNRKLVEDAGFHVVLDEIDGTGGEAHQVLLATAV